MKAKYLFLSFFLLSNIIFAQIPLYKQASAPLEARVQDLLQRMTLEEKAGQILCPMGWQMYSKNKDEVVLSSLFK